MGQTQILCVSFFLFSLIFFIYWIILKVLYKPAKIYFFRTIKNDKNKLQRYKNEILKFKLVVSLKKTILIITRSLGKIAPIFILRIKTSQKNLSVDVKKVHFQKINLVEPQSCTTLNWYIFPLAPSITIS